MSKEQEAAKRRRALIILYYDPHWIFATLRGFLSVAWTLYGVWLSLFYPEQYEEWQQRRQHFLVRQLEMIAAYYHIEARIVLLSLPRVCESCHRKSDLFVYSARINCARCFVDVLDTMQEPKPETKTKTKPKTRFVPTAVA